MKVKIRRLNAIVSLIRDNRVSSQEGLLSLLGQMGFKATQATLSRDLKILKVVKHPLPDGGYAYMMPEGREMNDEDEVVHEEFPLSGIISVEFSLNLGIIKTRPGFANGIASVIDGHGTEEILGTVAGDDTILLVARENVGRVGFIACLTTIIPGLGSKMAD